eukprot:TRINITY_DN29956_c0_g1_i1.p1 TRINITY_DN29956_c0_g1~~TRINITY_DN29956_c0_g1_i1.p1  ORF type:complete len:143 (+),score=23.39 TRINITY_DN29956_c0_g1_i1:183-611(+)
MLSFRVKNFPTFLLFDFSPFSPQTNPLVLLECWTVPHDSFMNDGEANFFRVHRKMNEDGAHTCFYLTQVQIWFPLLGLPLTCHFLSWEGNGIVLENFISSSKKVQHLKILPKMELAQRIPCNFPNLPILESTLDLSILVVLQ